MELNSAIILLLVYQSILFTILAFLLYYKYGDFSKKFLGWFMLLGAIFHLSKAAVLLESAAVSCYLVPIGFPLILVFFPLFYLYIQSLVIPGYRFRAKQLLQFLPALVLLLFPAALLFYSEEVLPSPGPVTVPGS